MAKRSTGKSGGNGHGKSKPKVAAPKKTAEQLSDQERQRLVLHHRRKMKPLLEIEKNAKAAVAKAFELAKKEGVTKKALQTAILVQTEEGAEKVRTQIQELVTIDRYCGGDIAEQLGLFDKQDAETRDFEAGRLAALEDKAARPPDHLPQKRAQTWLAGHADGVAQVNKQRIEGMRPLGGVVTDLMNKAGVTPPPAIEPPQPHVN